MSRPQTTQFVLFISVAFACIYLLVEIDNHDFFDFSSSLDSPLDSHSSENSDDNNNDKFLVKKATDGRKRRRDDKAQLIYSSSSSFLKNNHHHRDSNNKSEDKERERKRLPLLLPYFKDSTLEDLRNAEYHTKFKHLNKEREEASIEIGLEKWRRFHPVPNVEDCERAARFGVLHEIKPVFHSPKPNISIVLLYGFNKKKKKKENNQNTTTSKKEEDGEQEEKEKKDQLDEEEDRYHFFARTQLPSLLNYAKVNRYDLVIETEEDGIAYPFRPFHFSKLRLVRKWLPHYKFVLLLDMDVIVTNPLDPYKKLENLIARREAVIERENMYRAQTMPARPLPDVILGSDDNWINSGIVIFRNSAWTKRYLKFLWSIALLPDFEKLTLPFRDQGTFVYSVTGGGRRGRLDRDAEETLRHMDITDELHRRPEALCYWSKHIDGFKHRKNDLFVHFAGVSAYKHFGREWIEYYEAKSGCEQKLPLVARNFTLARPFFRTDLNATAPPLDEDLADVPLVTELRPATKRRPVTLRFDEHRRFVDDYGKEIKVDVAELFRARDRLLFQRGKTEKPGERTTDPHHAGFEQRRPRQGGGHYQESDEERIKSLRLYRHAIRSPRK